MKIEQGDLLKVQGLSYPVMVVSNTYFNQTGKCIVCPILKNAEEGPVHIRVQSKKIEGGCIWRKNFRKFNVNESFWR